MNREARSRLLLLLNGRENSRLLLDWLSSSYDVHLAASAKDLTTEFDLCIVDGKSLDRNWEAVRQRRELGSPTFLPVLLITSRKDVGLTTRHLWLTIDDVVLAPIERIELQARIETLLRARKLSLDLASDVARRVAAERELRQAKAELEERVALRTADLQRANEQLQRELGERRRVELELQRTIARLGELDQMKDEFISVAAHELKTPVAIIKGYSQLLLTGEGIRPEQRRVLEAVDRGSSRIDAIIRAILDVSLLHSGKLALAQEEFDLTALVGHVVERARPEAPKHTIKLTSAARLSVRGDRRRIDQVIYSLLDNAIRYSPKGGEVTVSASRHGREAIVTVSDRGIGIPPEKQSHVFERFYRAHTGTPHDYGGLGVSLYIGRAIVERLGGRMWLQSVEGRGTTIGLALPLAGDD